MDPLVVDGEIVGYSTCTHLYGKGTWNGSRVEHITEPKEPTVGLYYDLAVEMPEEFRNQIMDFYFRNLVEIKVNQNGFREITRHLRIAMPLPKFFSIR